ncbi:putative Transport protein particle (TRAPP) component [Blattamonas nauphoetae]|uniref:Transport protein particle (TRAPP) component n=1 Tax=Blattamonas nauphoetae TaxID=2049346 RepID=A0ABQ9XB65_9EUKA|nr:putative Transport protein particle (TRAPP) component [Blattamonas nauphoetae]
MVNLFASTSETPEQAMESIERIGFRSGEKFTEKLFFDQPPTSFQANRVGISSFLRHSFWPIAFKGNATILAGSYENMFTIEDTDFIWTRSFSLTGYSKSNLQLYLQYSCGMIRGAIKQLGYRAKVTGSCQSSPKHCQFVIEIS